MSYPKETFVLNILETISCLLYYTGSIDLKDSTTWKRQPNAFTLNDLIHDKISESMGRGNNVWLERISDSIIDIEYMLRKIKDTINFDDFIKDEGEKE